MKRHDFSNKRFRRLSIEPLEDRRLLSADFNALRTDWPDFVFPENSAELNVIEIAANDISLEAIRSALITAASTDQDDLVLIHTPDTGTTLTYAAGDSLTIDIDAENFGCVTLLADGGALTLNANSLERVLTVTGTSNVQIGNLTLTGGLATTDLNGSAAVCGVGGGIANAGTLTLDNVRVIDNIADTGKYLSQYNGMNSSGGGIYNAGNLAVFRGEISDNTARSGQANGLEQAAYGAGGGIFNAQKAILSLTKTIVSRNRAECETLILSGDGPSVTVQQAGCGAGIYNFGGSVRAADLTLCENSAWKGGGICNALAGTVGEIFLEQSLIQYNTAVDSGGGIFNDYDQILSIAHSTLDGNSAGIHGGGISNRSSLVCKNSVISGNSATIGGAIYSTGYYYDEESFYDVLLDHLTITGNSAGVSSHGSAAGIYYIGLDSNQTFSRLTVTDSIIVQNRVIKKANETLDDNITADAAPLGLNVLSTFAGWSSDSMGILLYDSSIPLFLHDFDFTNNTPGNYHLLYGDSSQAIDQGGSSGGFETDRDGNTRLFGDYSDLGAYELYLTDETPTLCASSLTIQEGCSFCLSTEGEFSPAAYLLDSDNDGNYQLREGASCWLSAANLALAPGTYTLNVRTIDTMLRVSDAIAVTVHIVAAVPTVCVRALNSEGGQLLLLSLAAHSPAGEPIVCWKIDWGNGETSLIRSCSNVLKTVHSYTASDFDQHYTVTLELFCADDRGEGTTYVIAQHCVEAVSAPALSTTASEISTALSSPLDVGKSRGTPSFDLASEQFTFRLLHRFHLNFSVDLARCKKHRTNLFG